MGKYKNIRKLCMFQLTKRILEFLLNRHCLFYITNLFDYVAQLSDLKLNREKHPEPIARGAFC